MRTRKTESSCCGGCSCQECAECDPACKKLIDALAVKVQACCTASEECCKTLTEAVTTIKLSITSLEECCATNAADIEDLAKRTQFRGARVTCNTQDIPPGSPTFLEFEDKVTFGYDIGGYFTGAPAADKFVVPAGEAGYYEIGGSALWAPPADPLATTGTTRKLSVTVDGLVIDEVAQPPVTGNVIPLSTTGQSLSTVYYLAVGAVLRLVAFQDTGANLKVLGATSGVGAQSPCFWLTKLG